MKNLAFAWLMLASLGAGAQLYETPETRRQATEAQRKVEAAKREELEAQASGPTLQQKEAEAMLFVGKTYAFVPDRDAQKPIFFFDRLPPSSHSQDPEFLLRPLSMTYFVVIGVAMAPPTIFPVGKDEYLLKIRFGDGKEAYVNYGGSFGLASHIKEGAKEMRGDYVIEYVSSEPPEVLLARERAAKEAAARELQLAKDKAEREERAAQQKAAREGERIAAQRQRDEKVRKDAIAAQMAKPAPRIGMTKDQVWSGTSWGRPDDIRRTTTALGTREQWIYDHRRYLYFDNGVLTAIQD
jgi:hypothetical protein